MRSIGFVLCIVGGLIIYLAWQSKLTDAFNALFKGQLPSAAPTKTYTPNPSASQALPGYTGIWHM